MVGRITRRGGGTHAARLQRQLAIESRARMEHVVRTVESAVKREALTGANVHDPFWGKMGSRGSTLGVRSGKTRQSITGRVLVATIQRRPAVLGVVGSKSKALALHEYGGETGRARIPTRLAQHPSGVDRHAGVPGRSIPNSFFWRSRSGLLWLAEKGTARAKAARELLGHPLLLYLYKDKVKHRERQPLRATLRRHRAWINRVLRGIASAAVRRM